MRLSAIELRNTIIHSGWEFFCDKFVQAFLRQAGVSSIGGARTAHPEEDFKEDIGVLLDHLGTLRMCVKSGPLPGRNLATGQTTGDYIANPSELPKLFAVFAPTSQDIQPIVVDRRELTDRCRSKEARVYSARGRPLQDPEKQLAERAGVAWAAFGYRPGTRGTGNLDDADKGFEFCLFMQVLAFLEEHRSRLRRAARRGSFQGDEAEDLKVSARRFGFCEEAAEVVPDLGLLLVKPTGYEIDDVQNLRCEGIRDGKIVLKWGLPFGPNCHCDSVIVECKSSALGDDNWHSLASKLRREECTEDRSQNTGCKFAYRVRSVYRNEEKPEGPEISVWIPDEPRTTEGNWGDGRVRLAWIAGRNSRFTLIFRRVGVAPSVDRGRPTDADTVQLSRTEESEYLDRDQGLRPGAVYWYLLVAEYDDGTCSQGCKVKVQIPPRPDPPSLVKGDYVFDQKTGEGKVALTVHPARDAGDVHYRVLRYVCERGQISAGTERLVAEPAASLSWTDQKVEAGKRYVYSAEPLRQGIPGPRVQSEPVTVLPGVWNLQANAGDRHIELSYEADESVAEVVIRRTEGERGPVDMHDGTRVVSATKMGARDGGLTNGHTYHYLIACRYSFPDSTEGWSTPQRTKAVPKVKPEPVSLAPRVEEGTIVCGLGDPRVGRLAVYRVAERPGHRYGTQVRARQIETMGTEIPVRGRTATDKAPDPNQPYYIAFTVCDDEGYAVVGECRKCAFVPPVKDLRWFLAGGGVRLTWKWPDCCNQALVVRQDGDYPGDPTAETDSSGNTVWRYRDEVLKPVSRAAYVEDGDSCYLPLDPLSGHWHITVRGVVRDIISPATDQGCRCVIDQRRPAGLDYAVYRKGNRLVLEWRVDRPCDPFAFTVVGSTSGVPSDTGSGARLFVCSAEEGWPQPDAHGVRRIEIASPYGEQSFYCRLFLAASEPARAFVRVRHPEAVLQPVDGQRLTREAVSRRPRGELTYSAARRQRHILCPYCFERFPWWRVRFLGDGGREALVAGWRRLLAAVIPWQAAPRAVLKTRGEKLCPAHCRQVRGSSGRAVSLNNRFFMWRSLHVGLVGTVRTGKSHWVFSAYRRLSSFGLSTVDEQTQDRIDAMRARVIEAGAPLDRTQRPRPDEIVPPLLFEAGFRQGEGKMVLALCDVDGDSWGVFGEGGKKRYLNTSEGLVLILDPLQMPAVRERLGKALPADAPKPDECEDQNKAIDELLRALRERGAARCRTPVAVVVSKGDVLRDSEAGLRTALWSAPIYHPGGRNPVYDMSLHWQVQFAVRDFLLRYDPALVAKVEDNFEDVAYFCVSPTGCSSQNQKFVRFAPWRVEEPILWLFARLGVIPTI